MYASPTTDATAMGEIRLMLTGLARGLDPQLLALRDATAMLGQVVAVRNVAAAIEGRLARRVADAREWERAGFPSAEAWLAQQTGSPLGKAKETLQTAQRLQELPEVAEAACAGELSAEQVAVITDAATADPSAERRLLESARRKPLSNLRDECAATKRAADPDPRPPTGASTPPDSCSSPGRWTAHRASWERRPPGRWPGSRRLSSDGGNQLFDHARNEGRREPREAYLMDALAQICEESLRGEAAALLDPPPSTSRHEGAVPPSTRRRRLPPGYLGLLRLDLEALQRGWVQGEETCEIAGLGPIPVSVARRLLGDAVPKLVLTKGTGVVNVTHLGRGPTVSQKMAMLWGTPGCAITACARMAGIEHDHRIEWAHTRRTTIGELDRLCDHHHDLKTYKGWAAVQGSDGATAMVPPTDPRHPRRARHTEPRAGPGVGVDE